MKAGVMMRVMLAGCLVTGVVSLLAVLVSFRELLTAPTLATYCVAAALAFGLSAVALSRVRE